MKNLLLVSLVSLSLWGCGPDAVASVSDDTDVDGTETYDAELTNTSRSATWFPMQAGNSWTFRGTSGTTRTISLANVGGNRAQLVGLFSSPVWVGTASDTSTTLQKWNGSSWEPFIRFGYAVTPWRTSNQVCSGLTGKRLSTGTPIVTPAGRFTDTRTIEFTQVISPTVRCSEPDFFELSFEAGVGLVAFGARGERFTLVSARVNGRNIPAPTEPDIQARVALDQVSYVSFPNTIRCITTPCPSNEQTASAQVYFSVINRGSTSKTWHFSTGCQFDVEITSASGRVVRRLSDGRPCTFALSSLTLGPGQSKSYSATMELKDKDGLQLDGTFGVKAKLIPSSNVSSAPSATTSLSVTVLSP